MSSAELRASIDRQVAAIIAALDRALPTATELDPAAQLADHRELTRQLAVLRGLVARAQSDIGEPRVLRAELATLLSFAGTLRADAENLHAKLLHAARQAARGQRAERHAQQRRAAERDAAMRRRDALQALVLQMAEGIADGDRRECRRTVPVVSLDRGVTVCSVGVATPKRRFRPRQFWLVTLTERRDDVLAIRT